MQVINKFALEKLNVPSITELELYGDVINELEPGNEGFISSVFEAIGNFFKKIIFWIKGLFSSDSGGSSGAKKTEDVKAEAEALVKEVFKEIKENHDQIMEIGKGFQLEVTTFVPGELNKDGRVNGYKKVPIDILGENTSKEEIDKAMEPIIDKFDPVVSKHGYRTSVKLLSYKGNLITPKLVENMCELIAGGINTLINNPEADTDSMRDELYGLAPWLPDLDKEYRKPVPSAIVLNLNLDKLRAIDVKKYQTIQAPNTLKGFQVVETYPGLVKKDGDLKELVKFLEELEKSEHGFTSILEKQMKRLHSINNKLVESGEEDGFLLSVIRGYGKLMGEFAIYFGQVKVEAEKYRKDLGELFDALLEENKKSKAQVEEVINKNSENKK